MTMTYTRVSHSSPLNDGSATDLTTVLNAHSTGLEAAETTIASHTTSIAAETTRATAAEKSWKGRHAPKLAANAPWSVMASPPTIAAVTTTSSISGGLLYRSVSQGSTTNVEYPADFWTVLGNARPSSWGTTYPDYNFVKYAAITNTSNPTQNPTPYSIEVFHYGTQIEFFYKGVTSWHQIYVDDIPVQSSVFTVANNGSLQYQLLTFGSADLRRIRFTSIGVPFGGIVVGATDTLMPSDRRGPKVVVFGDSYTGGTASSGSQITGFATYACEALGWYDHYIASGGGTGYLAGSPYTLADRVANDVIANNPDIVILAGGHNDFTYTPAQLGAAVTSLITTIKTALPNAVIIVLSEIWGSSQERAWYAAQFDLHDAIKNAAVSAGANYIDLITPPLNRTASSGTISNSVTASATTFVSTTPITVNSWVKIGASTMADLRQIISSSGSGPFTYTVKALTNAHGAGETFVEVGQPVIYGSGYSGATTGYGNADVLTSSDGTHLTDGGHKVLARAVAQQITRTAIPY